MAGESDSTATPADSGPESDRAGMAQRDPPAVASRPLLRRLRSGAFWLVFGRVCSVGAFMGAQIVLGKAFSEDDFSAYATASSTAVVLATLVVFGTPKILIRSLKIQLANGNAAAARSALASCVTMVVVMGGIGLVGLTVATDFVPSVPKWRGVRDFTLLIASWGGLSAVCLLAASSLQALDDFRSAALVGARKGGVLANGLFFVLLLVAHRLGHLELGAAIGLQVVLNLIALALGILLVRKRLEERQWPARSPDDDGPGVQSARSRHDVGWFFRESWPNFVVQMASITTLELQIILLGFFTSERAHADYSAVLYLVGLVNAFHALATSAIAPFVAELHTAGNVDKLERLLRGSATLVAIPTLAASLLFILFPEYLLTTAFTPDFANGAWALRIISIGGVIAVLSGSNGLVLVMSGQQRLLMRYSLAASITFVVAVIPATRHFGINGAATAVSVVFGVYNVWITLLVKSRIGVWTIPTFSPKSLWTTLRALRGS